MLMSRTNKVNEQLCRQNMTTDENWYLLLCSGEMPASVKDLEQLSPSELMKKADCGIIQVEGRRDQVASKEIVRFVHGENVLTPFGMSTFGKSPMPKRHFRQPQADTHKNTVKHYDFPCNNVKFNINKSLQLPLLRFIQPLTTLDTTQDTRYFQYNLSSFFIEMEEAGYKADSMQVRCQIQEGGSSTHYMYYKASYETPTDYEQIDATLDLSGAVEGEKVRIRNVDALPDDIKMNIADSDVQYLQNHCTVTRAANDAENKWVVNTIADSHGWITISQGSHSYAANVPFNWDSYNEATHINVGRFYRFERYSSGTGSNAYWYFSHFILRSNSNTVYVAADGKANGYISKPTKESKLDATWGMLVPSLLDFQRNSVTIAHPMVLVDVGGPNDGKAVALSEARGLDETSEPILMNLKTKIGVLTEKVVEAPVV